MRKVPALVLLLAALSAAMLAAPQPSAAAPTADGKSFDPVAATDAYLARMSPEQKARSDSYFEGGYWLQLWDFLIFAGLCYVILATGISRKMRDLARKWFAWKPLQTWTYWVFFLAFVTVITFPMTVYEGFVREHQYNLATQTFGPWLGDQAKGFGVGLVLGGVAIVALYGVLRRTPRTWWLWGAVTATAILTIAMVIAPVFIAPLFNTYVKVKDPAIREPILRLARANGIDAKDVYEFDASRQTTRVSANVSGFLGTMRISLNDNLMKRAQLPEIEDVMGHEMGHYVLNHVYKGTVGLGLIIVIGFALVRFVFERIKAKRGIAWGIEGVGDVAGLPLLALLLTAYFFLVTPITNTMTRTMETEADMYGLNAARQPDGHAEAALKLAEYRKMSPTPLEEFLFFDHPSGHRRIWMAMRWKAENLK